MTLEFSLLLTEVEEEDKESNIKKRGGRGGGGKKKGEIFNGALDSWLLVIRNQAPF